MMEMKKLYIQEYFYLYYLYLNDIASNILQKKLAEGKEASIFVFAMDETSTFPFPENQ